jgi:hypothetical protein
MFFFVLYAVFRGCKKYKSFFRGLEFTSGSQMDYPVRRALLRRKIS